MAETIKAIHGKSPYDLKFIEGEFRVYETGGDNELGVSVVETSDLHVVLRDRAELLAAAEAVTAKLDELRPEGFETLFDQLVDAIAKARGEDV